jgi:hypothetical protein
VALSWWLVTSENPSTRQKTEAIGLAQRAVQLTDRKRAFMLDTLAAAYALAGQFTHAVNVQREALTLLKTRQQKEEYRFRLKLYLKGIPYPDHGALATRATTLLQQGKFGEAELLARECLALRETLIPDNALTFNARSLLGASLLGQKEYAEAEPLLLSGYEGMKEREDQIPAAGKPRLTEALQRLVQLYQATGQSGKAAQWRQKLTQTDKSEASKQDGRQLKSN